MGIIKFLVFSLIILFFKEGKEQKRLAELQRKQEARALLAEEEAKIKAKPAPASSSKVTRAQIAEEKQKQAQLERKRAKEQAKVEEDDIFTEENPNQKMAEILAAEGASEARSVEEAIATLSVGKAASVDKHPEKRMKAAWTAFEAERLPVLKAENTNLRMSQLKQLLRKEWLKSPDNPLNQMR